MGKNLAEWNEKDLEGAIEELQSSNPNTRYTAALSLVSKGKKAAAAFPFLMKALSDISYAVRGEAAEALGKIGDVRAVPALVKMLFDESRYAKMKAARALENMGVPAVSALKKEALKPENAPARKEIRERIRRIQVNARDEEKTFGVREEQLLPTQRELTRFERTAFPRLGRMPKRLQNTRLGTGPTIARVVANA